MAITVLGGLLSSTVLNLGLLPVLVHRYGGPRRVHVDQSASFVSGSDRWR